MAVERHAPDAILAATEQSGAVTVIDEDPDASGTDFLTASGNNVATDVRVSFPTPTANPTVGADLQEFRIQVREFDPGQTGTPTARIELWENGSLVRAGSNVDVTTQDQVIAFTWNANELATANGSLVECKFVGLSTGGGPTNRNTTELGAVEWNADVTAGAAGGEGDATLALAALGIASTADYVVPGLLVRTAVGLLAVYIANDGDDPFVAADWELQAAATTVQVDGTTGELEVQVSGQAYIRHSAGTSRSKRMLQGNLYAPASPPADGPQTFPGIAAHMETGSAGDDALCVFAITMDDGEFNGTKLVELSDNSNVGQTEGGLPYKTTDTDYRYSLYVDGSNQASCYDFDQSEQLDLTPVALSSGHAGIKGCCNPDWANYKEWWDTADRNIVCTGLPTGHKLKVRNSSHTVLKSATESSGTATLDLLDVDLSDIADIVVTDGSDVMLKLFKPAAGDYVVGGDIYNFGGGGDATAALAALGLASTADYIAPSEAAATAALAALGITSTADYIAPSSAAATAALAALGLTAPDADYQPGERFGDLVSTLAALGLTAPDASHQPGERFGDTISALGALGLTAPDADYQPGERFGDLVSALAALNLTAAGAFTQAAGGDGGAVAGLAALGFTAPNADYQPGERFGDLVAAFAALGLSMSADYIEPHDAGAVAGLGALAFAGVADYIEPHAAGASSGLGALSIVMAGIEAVAGSGGISVRMKLGLMIGP